MKFDWLNSLLPSVSKKKIIKIDSGIDLSANGVKYDPIAGEIARVVQSVETMVVSVKCVSGNPVQIVNINFAGWDGESFILTKKYTAGDEKIFYDKLCKWELGVNISYQIKKEKARKLWDEFVDIGFKEKK